ncbi:MAG: efflux RND transporter periplasmic adaptor subunit [Gemmataceae bacterium]|nr:efflux RND transporter periplasmic adaptor subunit [Gemmataceae bacterium]
MRKRISELLFGHRFRTFAWGALVLLLTAAATWLWAHEGHAPLPTTGIDGPDKDGRITVTGESRDALGVQTADVGTGPVEERLLAYATLVAPWKQHAYVTTRLPGRVVKLHVKPGDQVKAGQALAEVESLELENLQAELIQARNDMKLSDKIVKEMEPLAKEGAVRDREFREAMAKHRENVNTLAIARSKWLSLGLTKEALDQLLQEKVPQFAPSLPILSPVSGVIIHADLTVGRVVEPTEHLFEVIDLSTLWVKIGVMESDLHKIKMGVSSTPGGAKKTGPAVELRFAAYPGQVFPGRVTVKGLYLDPRTRVGTVWAELSSPPGKGIRLLPGMHGQAQVVIRGPKQLKTAPATALIRDGAERYVLVETQSTAQASQYQKRSVVVARLTPTLVQFEGDVYPRDRVVTAGNHELSASYVQGVLRLSAEAKKGIGLRVEPVQSRPVAEVIELDGVVEVPPDRRALVSARLAGTLEKIHIERNQEVRKGEVIAEIASLELQKLQLDMLRAHLQLGLLTETLERLRGVDQLVARRQLWETESLYNDAQTRRDTLKRKLIAVGLSSTQVDAVLAGKSEDRFVKTLPLRSPIDGFVVHFDKVLGQVVKAEEPLFEVHNLERVWVQAFVSERDLPDVRIGQRVRVRLASDPSFLDEDATVVGSGSVLGAEDRTLSAWVELSKHPASGVQHNMLARVSLPVSESQAALALPLEAVVREGTRFYVFTRPFELTPEALDALRADKVPDAVLAKLKALTGKRFPTEQKLLEELGKVLPGQQVARWKTNVVDRAREGGPFERRAVETGRADDRYVEITRGLEAGERVAVRGSAELQTAYASVQ